MYIYIKVSNVKLTKVCKLGLKTLFDVDLYRCMGSRGGNAEGKSKPDTFGSRQSQFGAQARWICLSQQWREEPPSS